jgi:hypothetical protein
MLTEVSDPSSRQTGRPTSTKPELSKSNKNLVLGLWWGLRPRQTGRLTVGRNVTLTWQVWDETDESMCRKWVLASSSQQQPVVASGGQMRLGSQWTAVAAIRSYDTVADQLRPGHGNWGIYNVGCRYQVTTGEDNRLRILIACCSILWNVWISDGIVINCSYSL